MESSDSPLPNLDNVSHPDGVQQTEDFRPLEESNKPLEDSGVDASKNNRSTKSNASARKKTKAKKVVGSTSKRQSDETSSKKKKGKEQRSYLLDLSCPRFNFLALF